MALAELLATLERDGEAQVRAELAAAEADAARIEAAEGRARAERLTSAGSRVRAELRASADVQIADAMRAARTNVLAARAALLERLRPAVRAQLPDRTADIGDALVDAALAHARGGGELRCAPALVARARERALQAITVVADPTVTGVVLELANGARIEATLDAVLDRAWVQLAPAALTHVEVSP